MKLLDFKPDGKNKFDLAKGWARVLFKGKICKTRAVKHFDKMTFAGFVGKTKKGSSLHAVCVLKIKNTFHLKMNAKDIDESLIIYDKKAFFNLISKENW